MQFTIQRDSVSARSCVETTPMAPRDSKPRITISATIRRSLEFVPLSISSIRNRTGLLSSAVCIASRSRAISDRNFDLLSCNESAIEMDAHMAKGAIEARFAHTGAPAAARTAFRPIARSYVLFPDIFDPLNR